MEERLLVQNQVSTNSDPKRIKTTLFRLHKGGKHVESFVIRIMVVMAVIGLWLYFVYIRQVPSVALPAPDQVWASFHDIMTEGYQGNTLFQHALSSLIRIGIGFISASIIGVLLGFLMRSHSYFYHIFDPLIQFLRPIPPLIYIPLLQVWFGIGEMPKDVLIFLCALPFVTIGTYAGASSANVQMIRMSESFGANRLQIFRYVIFPAALPEIITSFRMALGMAWTCLVAAEMIAASSGLGWMALMAGQQLQTEIIFVSLFSIAILGYAMDVLLRVLQRVLSPWKGKF